MHDTGGIVRIQTRYFARLREALGPGDAIDLSAVAPDQRPTTVGELRVWLSQQSPLHTQHLGPEQVLRMACDQVLCHPGQALREGAEVAFFPPVTGG